MIKKLFTQYIDYSLILPMEEEIKLVEEYKYKFSQLNIPNNNSKNPDKKIIFFFKSLLN